MSTLSPQGPVVKVKPQANIYTALLFVAIVFMAVAIGVVLKDLFTTYGLSFGQLFEATGAS